MCIRFGWCGAAGATPTTAPAAAAGDPPAPGLKRQPSLDEAATKVQAFMRGAMVRATNKDNTLFNAWSQLDWRDESDLVRITHSHPLFD